MTRTGSIGSCVGPAVTRMCLPRSVTWRRGSRVAEPIHDRLGLGQAAGTELAARHLALGGFDHLHAIVDQLLDVAPGRGVKPHADVHRRRDDTGLSVASSKVVARSSAMPAAILASKSAVAGQTNTKSAARRQLNVADLDLVLELPQGAVNLGLGQAFQGSSR